MDIGGKIYEQKIKCAVPDAGICVRFPFFTDEALPCLRRINSYYNSASRKLLRFCIHNAPSGAEVYRCISDFKAEICGEKLLSVVREVREEIDGVRFPSLLYTEVWDMLTGTPLTIRQISGGRKITAVLALLEREDDMFYPPRQVPPALLRKHFRKEQFYLSTDGLHIFLQPCTIAPGIEGAVRFRVKERGD